MHPFFDSLDNDTLVITAGQRLSRALADVHTRHQCTRGVAVWERPQILPWGAWLQACWQASLDTPDGARHLLLAPAQEHTLWERVIAESEHASALLQLAATARVAQEAWRLLHEQRLPLAAIAQAASDDARVFAGWAQRFSAWCDGKGWLDSARLPDHLIELIQAGGLALPRRLLLAGFDELSPQQAALLQAATAAGCDVQQVEPQAVPAHTTRVECAAVADEVNAAARWARRLLEQNPHARIGIVAPALTEQRARVVRIFDEVLVPDALLPAIAAAPGIGARPYNLSLGLPLSDYPLVRSALLVLDLAQGRLPLEKVGALLRSPFLFGADAEMTRRALLDAHLRHRGETDITARTLMRAAGGWKDPTANYACPLLAQALQRWLMQTDTLEPRDGRGRALSGTSAEPAQHTPSNWTTNFARLLAALGWPGQRSLSSDEYQTLEAWRELLARFSGLDAMWPTSDYSAALVRLQRMAAEILFQPQTPDVPIQVLGVLEAAGMQFDHLWIMGMTDSHWPAPPRPNPLLPMSLQRQHHVPHASAERELEFSRRVTQRLLASAPEVIISHARRDGDRDLRISPLIASLPAVLLETLLPPGWVSYHERIYRAAGALDAIEDTWAPPVPEGTHVRGGTSVFKQQAACPFRAYAEYRLGAAALNEPEPGLDAAERGSLLHAVLEQVWDSLKSHAALCLLTPEEEGELVHKLVVQVIAAMARAHPQNPNERFLSVEKSRLVRLTRDWLAIERQRGAFSVVTPKTDQRIFIGGISVTLKIDRVDVLPDGDTVVVDYKTGTPDVGLWFGARPDEPQLPLYSVYMGIAGHQVGAVMFGQVRLGDVRYKGLACKADIVPGVPALAQTKYAVDFDTWDSLLHAWYETLTHLATAFRSGYAAVDPKDYPTTCRYCHLTPLCRIHEVNARRGRMAIDETDNDAHGGSAGARPLEENAGAISNATAMDGGSTGNAGAISSE